MSAENTPSPESVVRSFLASYEPKIQKLFRAVRGVLRKRFPTANELAYDYGSHIVISYSPTENGIDGSLAITARAEGVQLYFSRGKELKDPKKLLLGSAGARFVWVKAVKDLAGVDVKALMAAAVEAAKVPFAAKGKGRLIIRPTAASKRKK